MPPFGLVIPPSGGVWDACAACDFASPARGKGGLLGAAPLLGPLCTPPGTPPKKRFQFPQATRATRLLLRELPSLASLAQVISLRAAFMPESAFASINNTLQPNTINAETASGMALYLFPLLQDILASRTWKKSNYNTKMTDRFTPPVVMPIIIQP